MSVICVDCVDSTATFVDFVEYKVAIKVTKQHSPKSAMSTEPDDVNESIQSLFNETGPDLQSRSHVDAPNESLYMICGVLIAMFLVGVIIVLLAITISKLRKREENSVHPTVEMGPSSTPPQNTTLVVTTTANVNVSEQPVAYRGLFLWQQTNAVGSASQQQQYNTLYSNDQDTLVQNMQTERPPGFVRGFRKNIGGRWRRLVMKRSKPADTEVYTIPAELKPQLKQIYVY